MRMMLDGGAKGCGGLSSDLRLGVDPKLSEFNLCALQVHSTRYPTMLAWGTPWGFIPYGTFEISQLACSSRSISP